MNATTNAGVRPSGADDVPLPGRWLAMTTLLVAGFMNLIDVTIVNVALPSLQRAFGATSTQIEWVVAAYIFTFAVLLLPAGRMGDTYGRRQVFVAGVILFTFASALCGLAPSMGWLIAARVVQGAGGALMTPQTLALVPALFPPRERGGVFALFGLTAGLASVAGPVLGGVLIGADIYGLGWRPIFLVNIPIGILAVIATFRFVPKVPGAPSVGVDLVGMALAGTTLFMLLFPLIEGRQVGWPTWAFAMMAAAVPLGLAFVAWLARQARNGGPQVLPIGLLTQRSFMLGAGLAALLFSGIPGMFFTLALYFQNGYGLTPLQSGLTTVPFPAGVLLASLLSGRLGSRQLKWRITIGAAFLCLSTLILREVVLMTRDTIVWWQTALPLLMGGFGLGTAVSPLFQTVLSGVMGRDAGSASGAVQAFQQVGGSFGIAIMGELFFSRLTAGGAPDHMAFASALTNALIYATIAFGIIAVSARLLPKPAAEGQTMPSHPMPVSD